MAAGTHEGIGARGVLRAGPWALGLGAFITVLGCASTGGEEQDADEGAVGSAQQGVSCTVLRRTAIAPTAATDATIGLDPADPTRAVANYGGLIVLNVGAQGSATRMALVQFDLSPIPANVPIQSATLDLTVAAATGNGTAEVHRVTAPWTESTVTWSTFAGAYDTAVLGSFLPKSLPTNGHALIGVTALVQSWNTGTLPNHGVAVLETGGARAQLGASEFGNAGLRPTLTVCYAAPTCNDGLQNQGEGGVDCGGPCTPCFTPPASELVGAGTKASSPNYSAVFTLGQPSLNQDTTTSPSYRAQGGVTGATGTLP
jgi:hypothetical protein